jgi:hypothetical protein
MDKKDNFLEYVPVQNCPWGTDDKGKVYLIKEKTKNKLLKKIIGWLGRSQDFHIHLDELGSAAWVAPDGSRSILAKFFAMLARDGFMRWGPDGPR